MFHIYPHQTQTSYKLPPWLKHSVSDPTLTAVKSSYSSSQKLPPLENKYDSKHSEVVTISSLLEGCDHQTVAQKSRHQSMQSADSSLSLPDIMTLSKTLLKTSHQFKRLASLDERLRISASDIKQSKHTVLPSIESQSNSSNFKRFSSHKSASVAEFNLSKL